MPSRWFLPIRGMDPGRVRLEHVHAAFSRWFDHTPAEHSAGDKPYTLSPPTHDEGGAVGIEIATLTEAARQRLLMVAGAVTEVRVGNQIRRAGPVRLMFSESWASLAAHDRDDRWQLTFVTPTTFRNGNRSSPLPRVETIMDGLRRAWTTWADADLSGGDRPWSNVWASDVDLRSDTLPLRVRRPDGSTETMTVSGSLGTLTLRCDDPAAAAWVGPLLRSAAYVGVGGMTLKGLGVTRVYPHRGRQRPGDPEPARVIDVDAPLVRAGHETTG